MVWANSFPAEMLIIASVSLLFFSILSWFACFFHSCPYSVAILLFIYFIVRLYEWFVFLYIVLLIYVHVPNTCHYNTLKLTNHVPSFDSACICLISLCFLSLLQVRIYVVFLIHFTALHHQLTSLTSSFDLICSLSALSIYASLQCPKLHFMSIYLYTFNNITSSRVQTGPEDSLPSLWPACEKSNK